MTIVAQKTSDIIFKRVIIMSAKLYINRHLSIFYFFFKKINLYPLFFTPLLLELKAPPSPPSCLSKKISVMLTPTTNF